ncbi:MAG: exopolyphosphatase [Pseudonocardiales bacterium]|nr:MAG: exopolyphosphatase [Pseudonocardiales bacterium]
MRVAGIDCGTNSIRLLIADTVDGRLVDVVREMRIVRLGEGVDRTGQLAPAALERTRIALSDYGEAIAAHDTERVRMIATSATRDAQNRDVFVAMVRDVLGVEPEVVSGAEEAALSFAGAADGLPGVSGRLLVVDIGGGSTELVLGEPSAPDVLQSHSMDVGCVRMTERHLHDDPPTAEQVRATVDDLRAAISSAAADVSITAPATFVGLAGTVTTVAAIALGLERYDAEAIHGSALSAAQVHDVTARLLGMKRAELAALPVMHPGRVDVIAGGALVLRTLLEATGSSEIVASEHDILDGIALSVRAIA